MTLVQNIPNIQLAGVQTITFLNTVQEWHDALLTINRTISGGLNTLTQADTLGLAFDYSHDGGANWLGLGGSTLQGGLIVVKGVTLAEDSLGIGIGRPFPIGTGFRVTTSASTPVRITGTVTYE
jgi:hypothetical protein